MAHRRVLRVVLADVVQPVGDQDFVISEFLLGGLLAQVGNRQHRYVTGTVVTAPDAAALADAIEKLKQTPGWEIAGQGITVFCDWLRQDAFEMVEDRENVGETT